MTTDGVVDQARQRYNQKNLHAQLKSDVYAPHAPVQHPQRQSHSLDHGLVLPEPESVARSVATGEPALG